MDRSYQQVPIRDIQLELQRKIDLVRVVPAKMIERFGQPEPFDDHKISGIYAFRDTESDLFYTVYDWKATTLYDENRYFSKEQYWALTAYENLQVGGVSQDNFQIFQDWLYEQVGAPPQSWWQRLLSRFV